MNRPGLQIQFHEDNSTAVSVLKSGYSGAMRHIERNRGIRLRALAERFASGDFAVFYERSALMAADIYTKAFTGAPEWQAACKLINHLDPKLFWSGPGGGRRPVMPEEHKGGVKLSYWTPNPWHDQPADRGLVTQVAAESNDEGATAYKHG